MSFLEKIFGSQNERYLKRVHKMVDAINSFEPEMKRLHNKELTAKTEYFRSQLKEGKTLDDILPEAFAAVRETAWRTMGQRHYDVQLIGGITLHNGMIAEMKTGEGKTLSATLAVYLNAIEGKGVHVVTVNDYLAKRDAEWMSPVYNMLGLSVGCILSNMSTEDRRENYNKDITYGTNNEFGFDYLRDNMALDKRMKVQRDFNYCIVDEVDSVLIDEARTPLIISGQAENDTRHIQNARKLVRYFEEVKKNPDGRYPDEADPFNPQKPEGDYKLDEKSKNVTFSDDGIIKAEQILTQRNIIHGSIYNQENFDYVHYLTQALKAEFMFNKDVDYMVKENQVMIIDEHTGRVLPGRRYSDGLHQAIEAKEQITIQRRSKTFASITFQNFFRMYSKLSGMTGTADTEAAEFKNIYDLDVVVIPTNLPIARGDHSDRVYLTFKEKLKAILDEVTEVHQAGQPILIGTVSVESSEIISTALRRANIRHNVLNAKNHSREADIIAGAGRVGAVTVATNMAGRGTDIKLGGERKSDEEFEDLIQEEGITEDDMNVLLEMKEHIDKLKLDEAESYLDKLGPAAQKGAKRIIDDAYDWIEENKEVKELGGLFILGTERHESRRIDNQLRGRAGRQGDPGDSRFYISLEDDLMRLFGGERIQKMLSGFGMEEGELIEHPWITKAIQNAQKKVETRNFEIRKRLLEFDDVLSKQRAFIYQRRDEILEDDNIIERVNVTTNEELEDIVTDYESNLKHSNDHAYGELLRQLKEMFSLETADYIRDNLNDPAALLNKLKEVAIDELNEKDRLLTHDFLNQKLRELYLVLIDRSWQDHLENMEQLREAVYLRTYSQKNPLIEYKIEGSNIFEELIHKIKTNVVRQIFRVKIETVSAPADSGAYSTQHDSYSSFGGNAQSARGGKKQKEQVSISSTIVNESKVGRNDPCPCGSGKKYKKCCGK